MESAPEHYDEFSMFEENCREVGIPWKGRPTVERRSFDVGGGQSVSALVWGDQPPSVVFLHGGGQNAHTWDTVVLGLGRPALAIDLPGHGHSAWRVDRDYWPWSNAEAVSSVLDQIGARPQAVVGMSLGGLTTIRLGSIRPDLVPKAVIVDVTPGVLQRAVEMTLEERGTTALVGGPKIYESFDAMFQETMKLSPLRTPSGVRRGVLHNARRLDDGRWRWRYDIGGRPTEEDTDASAPSATQTRSFLDLWEDASRLGMPVMLVRGGVSKFVMDEHEQHFRMRKPDLRVEVVDGAGHAVQSDQPMRLVELIDQFVPQ